MYTCLAPIHGFYIDMALFHSQVCAEDSKITGGHLKLLKG